LPEDELTMLRRSPLKRSGFKRPMRHEPQVDREPRPMARLANAPNYSGSVSGIAVQKESPIRSKAIRESAKGEGCTVRIPGCPSDPLQTIWSHYRGSAGGKGGAIKASDVCGCYACTYCDSVYDGQHPRPDGMTKEAVDLAWHEGHIRSLVRLHQKGLL
jgi:hypothetical protein